MKYLFFSMVVSMAIMFYMSGAKLPPAIAQIFASAPGNVSVNSSASGDSQKQKSAESQPKVEVAPVRMVQVQGKWYEYRADNSYMIDGVPTFHVPKKMKDKEVAGAIPAPVKGSAANAPDDPNLQKSQELLKMAGDNPLSVYTPDGFKALKDGLDAAKNAPAENKNALEDIARDQ